jgi:hypothetical protein
VLRCTAPNRADDRNGSNPAVVPREARSMCRATPCCARREGGRVGHLREDGVARKFIGATIEVGLDAPPFRSATINSNHLRDGTGPQMH